MHHIYREIIAAIGGFLFIAMGIGRQRERRRLLKSEKKAEGPFLWSLLVIAGIALAVFAVGLIIYQLNHAK
ncbi:MAG: hypothetical protein ACXVB0_03305 [Mucilaginibacter sp.]